MILTDLIIIVTILLQLCVNVELRSTITKRDEVIFKLLEERMTIQKDFMCRLDEIRERRINEIEEK